jgi:hypothetical protein
MKSPGRTYGSRGKPNALKWLAIFLALGSLSSLVSCPPPASYDSPSFLAFTVCEDVDAYALQAVNPKSHFSSSDIRAVVFIDLYIDNLSGSTSVSCKWFSPSGTEEQSSDWTFGNQYRDRAWCWISIIDQADFWSTRKGEWRVEGWINGRLKAVSSFDYE